MTDNPGLDEATAQRAELVERITDALVQFDREQYEGYHDEPWPDDRHRLSRIARVNDAQHAAWAAQRHFVEGHGGIVGKLAADFYAATDEARRLRADRDRLSAALRSMARRSVHQRRWARRATAKSHKNLRAYEYLLRKLGSATGVHVGHPGEQRYPEFVERICAAALDLRAKNATQRAELSALRDGRVPGATPDRTEWACVDFMSDPNKAAWANVVGTEVRALNAFRRDGTLKEWRREVAETPWTLVHSHDREPSPVDDTGPGHALEQGEREEPVCAEQVIDRHGKVWFECDRTGVHPWHMDKGYTWRTADQRAAAPPVEEVAPEDDVAYTSCWCGKQRLLGAKSVEIAGQLHAGHVCRPVRPDVRVTRGVPVSASLDPAREILARLVALADEPGYNFTFNEFSDVADAARALLGGAK